MPFQATSVSLVGLQVRRSKLGNIRLVCDGDKNKVQASTVDRDKIRSNHQTDLAGTLSSFERSVAILASIWRPSQSSTADRDKIKSTHQTDLAGTLSSFESSVAILACIWRPSQSSTADRDKNKEQTQRNLADTLNSYER